MGIYPEFIAESARAQASLAKIVMKHELKGSRLATVSRSMPHKLERPAPCERLAFLCSFLRRIGLLSRL